MVVIKMKSKEKIFNILIVTLCIYLPFSWILFADASWEYKWAYLRMWPLLPGLWFTYESFHIFSMNCYIDHGIGMFVCIIFSALLYFSLVWLGIKNWKYLLLSCVISILVTIPTSLGVYAMFKF